MQDGADPAVRVELAGMDAFATGSARVGDGDGPGPLGRCSAPGRRHRLDGLADMGRDRRGAGGDLGRVIFGDRRRRRRAGGGRERDEGGRDEDGTGQGGSLPR